jgi:PmbA protein
MVAQAVPDRDQELSSLTESAQQALDQARHLGAQSAEVSASIHYGLDVNVRMGEVETLEHSRDRGLGISVYIGNSKGHATSGDLRPETIRKCVEKAIDIARFTQADKCNGLADVERLAKQFPDLDLWHPQALDAELTTQRALACEAAGLENPEIANSDGASASSSFALSVYANSNGFIGRRDGTRFSQSCVLIAGEGEAMQRDVLSPILRASRKPVMRRPVELQEGSGRVKLIPVKCLCCSPRRLRVDWQVTWCLPSPVLHYIANHLSCRTPGGNNCFQPG